MIKADALDIGRTFFTSFLLLIGCLTVQHFNPALFPVLSALYFISGSFTVFYLSNNARDFIENNYITSIGISLFFFGSVELSHLLVSSEIGVAHSDDNMLSAQLLVLGKCIKSFSFLIAPLLIGRPIRYGDVFVSFFLVSLFSAGLIFSGTFPDCRVNHEGMPAFANACGYGFALSYFLAIIFLVRKRYAFSAHVFRFLFLSVALFLLSEISFALIPNSHAYGFFLRHVTNILAFWSICKALTLSCLVHPRDSLFQELEHEREKSRDKGNLISAIQNDTRILVVVLDRQGHIVRFNRACELVTGYLSAEVKNVFVGDFLFKTEEAESARRFFANASVADFPFESENCWKAKDGSRKTIIWHSHAANDHGDSISAIIGIGIDVTERKQREKEIQFKASVLEHAGDSVLVRNSSGKVLYANQAFLAQTGYEWKDLLAIPSEKIEPAENTGRNRHRLERMMHAGKAKFESVFLKKDGTSLPVEVNARMTEIFGEKVVINVVRDISARKLYQRSLRVRYVELSALYKIAAAVSNTLNLDELFPKILDSIIELGMLDVERKGAIFVIENEMLKMVSFIGDPEYFTVSHEDVRIGDCLCGLAARRGEILFTKNIQREKRYLSGLSGNTAQGHVAIPLNSKNRLVGVMSLYLEPAATIDEPKIKLLRAIGDQVAMALENVKLYEEMKTLALHDPLTGFANRRLMEVVFERCIAEARRFKDPLSVMMVDIDFFKRYNDTYGHAAGDDLLVKFARVVSEQTREIDFVSRYGGEEFLIILPETELNDACIVAERIRKHVEEKLAITVSLGIAAFTQEIQHKEELVLRADNALYLAKQNGRNRFEIAS